MGYVDTLTDAVQRSARVPATRLHQPQSPLRRKTNVHLGLQKQTAWDDIPSAPIEKLSPLHP